MFAAMIAPNARVHAQAAATKAQATENSTTTPAPREGSWMTMHENFLKRSKEGKIDLLFLGDSITRGWDSRNKEGHGAREVWDRYYGARNAANFGIGGDRTQHVLWRLEHGEVDGISPKLVVLMIGTNNAGSNSPAEIAAGIEAIVAKLREKLPMTKILLLAVFPRGEKPGPVRERLQAVNARIARLDDDKWVHYLDIGNHFLAEDGTISREIMPDFLHLTRKGYQIWAEAIEPTVWTLTEDS